MRLIISERAYTITKVVIFFMAAAFIIMHLRDDWHRSKHDPYPEETGVIFKPK